MPMQVATDYIRHAARAARKYAGDPLGGPPPSQPPDAEFYKTLAKALEEIAAGLDALSKQERAISRRRRRSPTRLRRSGASPSSPPTPTPPASTPTPIAPSCPSPRAP